MRSLATGGLWGVIFILAACEGTEGEGGRNPNHVAVVPYTDDYIDVYGPMELRLEGSEAVVALDRMEQFSCEKPAFVVDRRNLDLDLVLTAQSERHHYWREVLPNAVDEDCIAVSLGHDNIWSGMYAFALSYPSKCYPIEFYLSFGGQEMKHFGTITSPLGEFRHFKTRPEYNREFLDAAREGRAIVIGGATGWVSRSWVNVGPCGEIRDERQFSELGGEYLLYHQSGE